MPQLLNVLANAAGCGKGCVAGEAVDHIRAGQDGHGVVGGPEDGAAADVVEIAVRVAILA